MTFIEWLAAGVALLLVSQMVLLHQVFLHQKELGECMKQVLKTSNTFGAQVLNQMRRPQ